MKIEDVVERSSCLLESEQSRKKNQIGSPQRRDTVSISKEAFKKAIEMFAQNFVWTYSTASSDSQNLVGNQNNNDHIASDYKSYFEQYRGKGIFRNSAETKTAAKSSFKNTDTNSTNEEQSKTVQSWKDKLEI